MADMITFLIAFGIIFIVLVLFDKYVLSAKKNKLDSENIMKSHSAKQAKIPKPSKMDAGPFDRAKLDDQYNL